MLQIGGRSEEGAVKRYKRRNKEKERKRHTAVTGIVDGQCGVVVRGRGEEKRREERERGVEWKGDFSWRDGRERVSAAVVFWRAIRGHCRGR